MNNSFGYREHVVFIEASVTGSGERSLAHAKNTGRFTTLVTRDASNYPDSITKHADRIIQADTNDPNAIIGMLESAQELQEIDGILTTNDFFVVQTAAVAEHFGVPTTSASDVHTMKNKYLMRQALESICPELNPKFALVQDVKTARQFVQNNGYPFIAKPQDANDSLYVQLIRNDAELDDYFLQREKWGRNLVDQSFASGVLLEQLIGGDEYCLDVLQPWLNDMIAMGAFCKKLSGQETGNFVKIGASFPTDDAVTDKLFEPISKALKELGVRVGAVNVDCKISDGQVKILEINPRLVGDQMGSHMIALSTGINPAHLIVEIALGKQITWVPHKTMGTAIHRITMPEAGYFSGILNREEILTDPNVAYVNELGTIGAWYEPARSNQQVIGSVIATAATSEAAMQIAERWAMKAKVLDSFHSPSGLAKEYKKAVGVGYSALAQAILAQAEADQKLSTYMPQAVSETFEDACSEGLWDRAATILQQTKGDEFLLSEIEAEKVASCFQNVMRDGDRFTAEKLRQTVALNQRFERFFHEKGLQLNS